MGSCISQEMQGINQTKISLLAVNVRILDHGRRTSEIKKANSNCAINLALEVVTPYWKVNHCI